MEFVKSLIQTKIQAQPWLFAICLFGLSILLVSQATTTSALLPLGVDIGIPGSILLPMFPAVNGLFFLPNHPTIIAAINFDTTGFLVISKSGTTPETLSQFSCIYQKSIELSKVKEFCSLIDLYEEMNIIHIIVIIIHIITS